MYEVLIQKKFSSAHFLRNYHGVDEPLHGHNWKVEVLFRGEKLVEPEQYLIDFVEVEKALAQVVAVIDYKNINDVPPFDKKNSSAENIAEWVWREMSRYFPKMPPVAVTIWEKDDCAARYLA